ncbi:unnamed protein product [Mytilus coruscus]|uniref:Uncharacterized protein n=1 Tax=Mytilus coruscus TaxID=42192 RepID=A0A6J8DSS1_MYTCO|nr:unnamed protein product [Mytilus coruscus]
MEMTVHWLASRLSGKQKKCEENNRRGDETDSNTDISDYEEDRDYFGQTFKHIRKIRRVKTIQGIRDIEKTVTVRTDDVDVKVEPDSGADVNVMDENQFLTFQKKTYNNPVLEKRKSAIEQGFKHYQVIPGRQRANGEANVFRKPINKTEQITKLKKKNNITAKQEISMHRGYHSNLYEKINERDGDYKEKIKKYAENRSKKMKKMDPPKDRRGRGRRTKVMGPRKTCAGGGG